MFKNLNFLIVAGMLSGLAALLHVGCIVFGAEWYRFFGAGEEMARLAEQGDPYPTIVTSVIVLILLIWSCYALSGAGVIRRLPLLRAGLFVITGIYLLRGIAPVFTFGFLPDNGLMFWIVSSLICFLFGVIHLIGMWQMWFYLNPASLGSLCKNRD